MGLVISSFQGHLIEESTEETQVADKEQRIIVGRFHLIGELMFFQEFAIETVVGLRSDAMSLLQNVL